MARNRYVRYYRLVETVDERGRFHTRAEYIGDDYAFAVPLREARRAARNGLLTAVVGWLFYFAALLLPSAGTRTWMISFPFVLTAVPLGLCCGILWEAFRKELPLDARMHDRLENRYPVRGLSVILLPLVSLIGEAVLLLRGAALLPGDGVLFLSSAVLAACGMLLFQKRKVLRCHVLPKAEEGDPPADIAPVPTDEVGGNAQKSGPGDPSPEAEKSDYDAR